MVYHTRTSAEVAKAVYTQMLHFIICHSKKCHRPRTSSCLSICCHRVQVIIGMYDNICLDMRSSS